jgi:hypothetical protein
LSYTSQDAEAARRIYEAFSAAGIEVWFDQSELRGGDAWDRQIRKRIQDCALFMPVISTHSQERLEGYFRLEWKVAVDRSHLMAAEKPFLLPVVVDDTQDSDAGVPDKFREVQWTSTPSCTAAIARNSPTGEFRGTAASRPGLPSGRARREASGHTRA